MSTGRKAIHAAAAMIVLAALLMTGEGPAAAAGEVSAQVPGSSVSEEGTGEYAEPLSSAQQQVSISEEQSGSAGDTDTSMPEDSAAEGSSSMQAGAAQDTSIADGDTDMGLQDTVSEEATPESSISVSGESLPGSVKETGSSDEQVSGEDKSSAAKPSYSEGTEEEMESAAVAADEITAGGAILFSESAEEAELAGEAGSDETSDAAETEKQEKVVGSMQLTASIEGITPNYGGTGKKNTVWDTSGAAGRTITLKAEVSNLDAGSEVAFEWTSNETTTPIATHPDKTVEKGKTSIEDTLQVTPSAGVYGYFCTVSVLDEKEVNRVVDHRFAYIIRDPLQISAKTISYPGKDYRKTSTKQAYVHIRPYDGTASKIDRNDTAYIDPGSVQIEVSGSSRLASDIFTTNWETTDQYDSWSMEKVSANPGAFDSKATLKGIDGSSTTVTFRVSSKYSPEAVYGVRRVAFTIDTGSHTYGDFKVTKEASIQDAGRIERTCSVCGYVDAQTLAKLTPTISANMKTIPVQMGHNTDKYKVTVENGDEIVQWQSSDRSICTVVGKGDGSCVIRPRNRKGRATITATSMSGLTISAQVRVQKKKVGTKSISGLPASVTMKRNGKKQLEPVLSPLTTQYAVSYKSSRPKIAAVNKNGVIRALAPGKTVITVTSGKVSVKVPVTVKGVDAKAIRGVKSSYKMKKGKTRQLKVTLSPKNSTSKIRYKSSDQSVVSVTSSGKLKAKKKGTAVITIRAVNPGSGAVTKKVKVTVR